MSKTYHSLYYPEIPKTCLIFHCVEFWFFHTSICVCLYKMFGFVFIKLELHCTRGFNNLLFSLRNLTWYISRSTNAELHCLQLPINCTWRIASHQMGLTWFKITQPYLLDIRITSWFSVLKIKLSVYDGLLQLD